jgi:hypothetical protein
LSEGAFGGTEVIQVREGVWSVVGYSLNNYTFVEGETGLSPVRWRRRVSGSTNKPLMIRR